MENFKIIEKKENPLFNRQEIKTSIEADITPSNADVEKFLSEKLSAPVENIHIKKIAGRFGTNTFTITANVYSSNEHKKIESKAKKSKKSKEKK